MGIKHKPIGCHNNSIDFITYNVAQTIE